MFQSPVRTGGVCANMWWGVLPPVSWRMMGVLGGQAFGGVSKFVEFRR